MTEQERLMQANLEALMDDETSGIITCYTSAWGGYWYGYTCDPCGSITKHNGENKSSCLKM